MTPLPLLGTDPGQDSGACALLDPRGESLDAWLCWASATRRGVRGIAYASDAAQLWGWVPLDDLARPLAQWRPGHAYRLAVEGLFAHRGTPQSPSSLQTLGEAAGVALGVLRLSSVGPVHRPLANDWRKRQLGLRRRLDAAAAEQYAITCAERTIAGLPGLEVLEARGMAPGQAVQARGALCEACWIARDLLTVTG